MAFGRVHSPYLEAPPLLTVSHLTRAALKSGRSPKIRSSKPEGRKKAETRNPRMAGSHGPSLPRGGCGFGNWDFSLLSACGLRVSALERTESSLEHPCHLTVWELFFFNTGPNSLEWLRVFQVPDSANDGLFGEAPSAAQPRAAEPQPPQSR